MPIIYRDTDNTKWGPGKDANLTKSEVDNNFWTIDQRVAYLETHPPTAVSISNIVVSGSQVQFNMSDGSHFGPFTMPIATFQYRPEGFVAGQTYNEMDLIPIPQQGLFLARIGFTATGTHLEFDPEDTDVDGNKLYTLVYGENTYIYDFGFSFPGKPGVGVLVDDEMAQHLFLRDVYLPVDCAGSLAKLIASPTADLVYEITKNGTTIGTLTFPASTTEGVFSLADATQFTNGDTLGLKKITDTDATAKGFRCGFAGVQGTL